MLGYLLYDMAHFGLLSDEGKEVAYRNKELSDECKHELRDCIKTSVNDIIIKIYK